MDFTLHSTLDFSQALNNNVLLYVLLIHDYYSTNSMVDLGYDVCKGYYCTLIACDKSTSLTLFIVSVGGNIIFSCKHSAKIDIEEQKVE